MVLVSDHGALEEEGGVTGDQGGQVPHHHHLSMLVSHIISLTAVFHNRQEIKLFGIKSLVKSLK